LKEVLKHCENKPEIVDKGIPIYGFEKVRIEVQARDV